MQMIHTTHFLGRGSWEPLENKALDYEECEECKAG